MTFRGDGLGKDLKFLRIGELAEAAGVSSRTIDYYTKFGLIKEEVRTLGKHRLYSEEALKDIRLIKELQKQHYTLEEIKNLFINKRDHEVIGKFIRLRGQLEEIQKEAAGLYPTLQLTDNNDQVKAASRELTTKVMQVMQSLIIMLGDGNL